MHPQITARLNRTVRCQPSSRDWRELQPFRRRRWGKGMSKPLQIQRRLELAITRQRCGHCLTGRCRRRVTFRELTLLSSVKFRFLFVRKRLIVRRSVKMKNLNVSVVILKIKIRSRQRFTGRSLSPRLLRFMNREFCRMLPRGPCRLQKVSSRVTLSFIRWKRRSAPLLMVRIRLIRLMIPRTLSSQKFTVLFLFLLLRIRTVRRGGRHLIRNCQLRAKCRFQSTTLFRLTFRRITMSTVRVRRQLIQL